MIYREILSLGRIICFSIFAPLIFLYNWMRNKFMLPVLLQSILLLGYVFAIAYAISTHTIYAIVLYCFALFFIILNMIFTVISVK